MIFDDYMNFSRSWLAEAKRVLTDDGAVYIILENELNMYFNSWITWYYTQGIGRTCGYSPRHDDILFTNSILTQ